MLLVLRSSDFEFEQTNRYIFVEFVCLQGANTQPDLWAFDCAQMPSKQVDACLTGHKASLFLASSQLEAIERRTTNVRQCDVGDSRECVRGLNWTRMVAILRLVTKPVHYDTRVSGWNLQYTLENQSLTSKCQILAAGNFESLNFDQNVLVKIYKAYLLLRSFDEQICRKKSRVIQYMYEI